MPTNFKAFYTVLFIPILVVMIVSMSGCSDIANRSLENNHHEAGSNNETGKEGSNMEQEQAFLNNSIPPLDARVPENLATATLGLG